MIFLIKAKPYPIEPIEWLIPVSNPSKIEEKGIKRLEPADFRLTKTKNRALDPVIAGWGGIVDSVRTIFQNTDKYIYIPDLNPKS